jgi:hypothetical protein
MVSSRAMVGVRLRRDSTRRFEGAPGGGSTASFPRVEEPRSETDVGVAKRQKKPTGKIQFSRRSFSPAPLLVRDEGEGGGAEGELQVHFTADRHREGGELGGEQTQPFMKPGGQQATPTQARAHRIGEDPRCICCQNKIEYQNPLSLGNRRSGGGEVISQSVGDLDSIPLPGCPRRAGWWPVPRGQAAELWASPDPASMEHGVLRLGSEWVVLGQSAIGRRGVGALGPRSRWDRGKSDSLAVWPRSGMQAGCGAGVMKQACSSRLPDLAGNAYRAQSRAHGSWCDVVEEVCGTGIQHSAVRDDGSLPNFGSEFREPAVPSGPPAGRAPLLPPPLWWGRDVHVEPGPPGALLIEGPPRGPVSRRWERRRHVVSASQVQSHEEEGKGGSGRDRDTHQAMKPTRRRPVPHVPH